jgi:hypothetical protein
MSDISAAISANLAAIKQASEDSTNQGFQTQVQNIKDLADSKARQKIQGV